MKRKRIAVISGLILFVTVLISPITILAAPSEVVTMTGSGTIGSQEKPAPKPGKPSGVGTVSKLSGPKTGDWNNMAGYLIMMSSGLAVLLLLLLLKWYREENRELNLQKF